MKNVTIRSKFYQRCFCINPHAPVAQKIVDEVGFRRFLVEGVEFFLIGRH